MFPYSDIDYVLNFKVLSDLEEEEQRRDNERLHRENINEKKGLALDIIRPGEVLHEKDF